MGANSLVSQIIHQNWKIKTRYIILQYQLSHLENNRSYRSSLTIEAVPHQQKTATNLSGDCMNK